MSVSIPSISVGVSTGVRSQLSVSVSLTVEVGSPGGSDRDHVVFLGHASHGVSQVQPLASDPVRQQLTDLLRPALKQ